MPEGCVVLLIQICIGGLKTQNQEEFGFFDKISIFIRCESLFRDSAYSLDASEVGVGANSALRVVLNMGSGVGGGSRGYTQSGRRNRGAHLPAGARTARTTGSDYRTDVEGGGIAAKSLKRRRKMARSGKKHREERKGRRYRRSGERVKKGKIQ